MMETLSVSVKRFNLLAGEIDAAYHLAARKLGLSDSERDILYLISQEDVSQADICRMTGMSKQTVHSSVHKMIGEGLFEPLTGKKNEKLVLTEAGRVSLEATIGKLIRAENRLFERWGQANGEAFLDLNRQFLKMLLEEIDRF